MALALDLGAHARQHLVAVDRPHQVVVDAHVEAAQQARLVARLDQDDDRQMARALERAHLGAQPQAVRLRQAEADDQQVAAARRALQQRLPAGRARRHGMRPGQRLDHARGAARVILDDQDAPALCGTALAERDVALKPICLAGAARIIISSLSTLRRARFLTRVTSAMSSTGLVRKSSAPASSPCTLSAGWSSAVTMMTGTCAVAGSLLDAPADLEAVHARHHDVEQHHVDALARADVERFGPL